jgi:hypothetical protein
MKKKVSSQIRIESGYGSSWCWRDYAEKIMLKRLCWKDYVEEVKCLTCH